jgi:hypothetical protein
LATTNKNFKVKNGLDVNSNATVDSSGNANVSGNITANSGYVSADTFRLDTTYTGGSTQPGEISWDPDNETAMVALDAGETLQIGQEHVIRVKNSSASVAIPKGRVVMFAGATGDTVAVTPAISTQSYEPLLLVGVTAEEIAADGFGFVTQYGFINQVSTGSFTLGDLLYVDPASPGVLTNSAPSAPNWTFPVAAVTRVHASAGRILVRAIPGGHLHDVVDVAISSPANNQVLTYSSGIWINANATGGSGNSFETISANGTSIVADSSTDTLTITPGDGLSIAGNATSDTITFTPNVASESVNGIVTTATQTFAGGKTFTSTINANLSGTFVTSSRIRLTNTEPITNVSGAAQAFQIGPDNNINLRMSPNSIGVYNNGALSRILINPDGGEVSIGATTSNVVIIGSTQLELEETQAVVDVNNSYTYLTNTYTVNLASGNYFSNITLTRAAPAQAWTYVANTRTTTTAASGTFTLPSGMQNGDYVAIVIGCDTTGTYPNVTTTTYGTWTVTNSGSTTHPARLFVKRITDAVNETSVAYTTTAGATAIAALAIRNAASTATAINNTTAVSASFNPPATTTSYANAAVFIAGFTRDIAVTAVSHANTAYNGNLASISTTGLAAGVNAAVFLGFATIPTASAEDPATFTVTGGTAGNSAAFSAAISSYVDPTINVTNPSLSATYPASTYVLHINNANNLTTTWSGQTFAWQGGTAPTLSSTSPNNIIILETINGTTFRGAALTSYA